MNCSFSPQISDSKREPSRREVAHDLPVAAGEAQHRRRCRCWGTARRARCRRRSRSGPTRSRGPRRSRRCARTSNALSLTRRAPRRWPPRSCPRRGSGTTTYDLGAHQRPAVRPGGDVRRRGEDADRVARSMPLDISGRRPAGARARCRSSRCCTSAAPKPLASASIADEHRDHEPDAERGERGRDRPLQHAAEVVDERDLHSTFLSAVHHGQPRGPHARARSRSRA